MKKFTQVTKKINGTEYTAQFNGFGGRYDAVDRTYIDGTQTTSMRKIAEYLLENVLVTPKKTLDDFEDAKELDEVIAFLGEVNNGTFQEESDEGSTDTKSKR